MELREKIISEIAGEFGGLHKFEVRAQSAADAILDIPEIKEALLEHAKRRSAYVVVEGFDAEGGKS
jgi:hypothetical protein